MTLAHWRSSLQGALHRNRSLVYSRYVQLATVRLDGRPANRTVVFRGFLEPDRLQFITDARSDKAEQMMQQRWGEVCWYFPKTREQFRLLGELTLVGADEPAPGLLQARQTLWQNLSDMGRVQFAWPHPGQPRDSDGFDPPPPDPQTPPPNFCLLLLDPVRVDHLELRGEPQNRRLYLRSAGGSGDEWTTEEVNP